MKKTCFIFLITAMSLCFALQTSSFADDLKGTFLDLKVYLEQGTSEETTEDVGELTAHVIEKLDLIKDVKDLSADQKEYLRTKLTQLTVMAENRVDPGRNGAMLAEAVRLFPEDFRLSVKLEKAYVELGQYEPAVKLNGEVLTRVGGKTEDPELTTVFCALQGLGLMMSRNLSAAKDSFNQVLDRDDKWTGGYFLMAAYYLRSKDYKRAEEYFNKCLAINPNHEGAVNMLGMMRERGMIVADSSVGQETKK